MFENNEKGDFNANVAKFTIIETRNLSGQFDSQLGLFSFTFVR